MRRALLAALAALLSLIALLGLASPASAHAELLETTPSNGKVLSKAPQSITLRFNAPVETRGATVRVIDMAGAAVAGMGAPTHVAGTKDTLTVTVPKGIGAGTQAVVYRVVSADGHPIQGQFSFSVGVMTAATVADRSGGDNTGGIRTALGFARWAAFAGLALLIGTGLLLALAWPAGIGVRGVQRLLTGGATVLIASTAVSLLLHGPFVLGSGFSSIWSNEALTVGTDSRVGRLLIVRIGLVGLLLLAAVILARLQRNGRLPAWSTKVSVRAGAVLALGLGFGLTWSLAVHTAGGGRLISLPVDLVHLLAMGAWLGGLPALLILLRSQGSDSGLLSRAAPAFSRTAMISVAALLITGTLQAWRQVGSFDALFGTTYGGWLVAKLALVVGLLGLGALARKRVQSMRTAESSREGLPETVRRKLPAFRLPTEGLGRVVAVETALGVVILGVTAALVSTQPAAAAYRAEQAAGAVRSANSGTPVASPVDTLVGFRFVKVVGNAEPKAIVMPAVATSGAGGTNYVQAVISPAVGGLPNELHVSITDVDGLPIQVASALVDLRLPGRAERSSQFGLVADSPGHFSAPFTLPAPGAFELGVLLQSRDGTKALVLIPLVAA